MTREWLSTREAAETLGLGIDVVQGMCRDGQLGAKRRGRGRGVWRIPRAALTADVPAPPTEPKPADDKPSGP